MFVSETSPSTETLVAAGVHVPPNVVYRAFAAETVVLNLETGMYHGLNPTAGRMLETLDRVKNVGEAITELTEEFGQPRDEIESDLCTLCRQLLERGLLARQD